MPSAAMQRGRVQVQAAGVERHLGLRSLEKYGTTGLPSSSVSTGIDGSGFEVSEQTDRSSASGAKNELKTRCA